MMNWPAVLSRYDGGMPVYSASSVIGEITPTLCGNPPDPVRKSPRPCQGSPQLAVRVNRCGEKPCLTPSFFRAARWSRGLVEPQSQHVFDEFLTQLTLLSIELTRLFRRPKCRAGDAQAVRELISRYEYRGVLTCYPHRASGISAILESPALWESRFHYAGPKVRKGSNFAARLIPAAFNLTRTSSASLLSSSAKEINTRTIEGSSNLGSPSAWRCIAQRGWRS